MLGRGEIFKLPVQQENKLTEKVAESKYAVKQEAGIVTILVDNQTGQENIVMVDTRAAAGYPQAFLEPEYLVNLPRFSLPGPQFRNAIFRCFQVSGDSMTETLYDGDWVIASYIESNQGVRSSNAIKETYLYVIIAEKAVLVKRLLNHVEEQSKLVLVSDNEAYAIREIDVKDVREL